MSVGSICTRKVFTAAPNDSVREAAVRMKEHHVGSLLVLGDDRIPVGILTDRDIAMQCVADDNNPEVMLVSETMTEPVRTVPESLPIEDALAVMAGTAARRAPVVNTDGELVGLLALDDILELLSEEAATVGRIIRSQAPN